MTVHAEDFTIRTRGAGTYEVTRQLREIAARAGVREGLLHVFVRHTSASLVIYENAAPEARDDLHEFFGRLVPENEDYYTHNDEGPDDLPSHLRMALTRTSETIPVRAGSLALGTWQGVFLFEHRRAPHSRELAVTVMGMK